MSPQWDRGEHVVNGKPTQSSNRSAFSIPHPEDLITEDVPTLSFPEEIACFSYDEDHQLHIDGSGLRYYYTPSLGVSLAEGFDTFRKRDDSKDDHLGGLLETVIDLEKRTGILCEADFITWRGMMTKLMLAAYQIDDGFEMNATLFQVGCSMLTDGLPPLTIHCEGNHVCFSPLELVNVVPLTDVSPSFIEESHEHKMRMREAEKIDRIRPGRPSPEVFSYYGYKFETLCLLPRPWAETSREYIENRPLHQVSNYSQYVSVVKTSIRGMNLILGGEVDGIWDAKPADPGRRKNWVELKTSAQLRTARDQERFELKLAKFWAQSFLLGVPKIIVGFRATDPRGTLVKVEEYETTKIPQLVRAGSNSWDGKVFRITIAKILKMLKENITSEGVWKIRKQKGVNLVETLRTDDTGFGDILTQDFLDWRKHFTSALALASFGDSSLPEV